MQEICDEALAPCPCHEFSRPAFRPLPHARQRQGDADTEGHEMRHILLPTRSHLHQRWSAITMTWLLLVIFYGLSAEMNTAQAQARAYVKSMHSVGLCHRHGHKH